MEVNLKNISFFRYILFTLVNFISTTKIRPILWRENVQEGK